MTHILTHAEQLTPDLLTHLLQRKGVLHRAQVADIYQTRSNRTNISSVSHLAVRYTAEEQSAPKQLFLKTPNPDFGWGNQEIRFYNEILPTMLERYGWNELPFLHCYDVAYSADSGQSHFLFEDITDNYFTTDGMMPTAPQHRNCAIDAFAQFHSFWWEHPKLGKEFGERQTEERIIQFLKSAQEKLDDFVLFMGKRLSQTQHEILKAVASEWPKKRQKRLLQGQGITLVHRDPHPLNLMYSHNLSHAKVKLIDWQSWRVDTGTDDLAYFIACHWPLDARKKVERPLIQRYHQQLLHLGVENYIWDDCWYDYRASVIRCLFFLIGAWAPAQWECGWWWEKMTQGMSAFEHLNCMALLAT